MVHSFVLRKAALHALGLIPLLIAGLALCGPSARAAETDNLSPPPTATTSPDQQTDIPESNAPPPVEDVKANEEPPPSGQGRVMGAVQAVTISGLLTSAEEPGQAPYLTYKTPFEFFLTLLTAGLGVFLVLVLAWMARKTGITEPFVRAFMVVTIVFGALFLVVAGYSDEQTAPVFGLLGTIVGYIFGRYQSTATEPDDGEPPRPGDGGEKPDPQQVGPQPNPAGT